MVFNKAGPNWARVRESAERVRAHQQIYRRLADEGQLIVGGVLVGDTPLGVAIFCPGVDRTAIRRELENDELVTQEMIALEYREWRTQLGELQHRCPPA